MNPFSASVSRHFAPQITISRGLSSNLWPFKNPFKKKDAEPATDLPIQPAPQEPNQIWELSEEEIARICDKSGLDDESKELERRQLFAARKFDKLNDYKRENIRKFYALYGKDSGIKPGICWPNKEELDFHRQFEETFYPTLSKLMSDAEAKRKELESEKKARERTVLAALKKRDQFIEEFYEKRAEKLAEEEEERKRNEKLVAEVKEYLGFNIDSSDPRFQEALAKKEEEERQQARKKLKKDKAGKVADMLRKMLDVPVDDLIKPTAPTETPASQFRAKLLAQKDPKTPKE